MKANILSIDGGGIRGILPAMALAYLEERLMSYNKNTRLADYFDLMAGTSTGGIIAALLSIPDEHGRPRFTAAQAVDLYVNNGGKIFDESLWKRISSLGGVTDEKYSASNLEKLLKQYTDDVELKDTVSPILLTAYDIRNRRTCFFNSADAMNPAKNFYVRDLCRATSAAPTYFEPARIQSLSGTPFALVDGGLFANNPAMTAYAEARTMDFRLISGINEKPSQPAAADMFILSLGTGMVKKPYYYEEAKNWGNLQWIKPVIDILMSGSNETVDYELRQIFSTCSTPGDYVRLMPDISSVDANMDDASSKNIKALQAAGQQFVEEHKDILNTVADKLEHYSK